MIDALNAIDVKIFFFFNSLNTTWLNPVMVKVSGQAAWYPVFLFFIYLSFKKFGKKKTAIFTLFLVLTMLVADVISSQIIKNIFMRLRPCRVPEILAEMNNFGQKCGGRFGFVSSHAANTFAAMTFIIGALKLQRGMLAAALALPVIVSFSRIYLGVHYPGDIIGGTIVGVLSGLFFVKIFENLQGAKRDSSQP